MAVHTGKISLVDRRISHERRASIGSPRCGSNERRTLASGIAREAASGSCQQAVQILPVRLEGCLARLRQPQYGRAFSRLMAQIAAVPLSARTAGVADQYGFHLQSCDRV